MILFIDGCSQDGNTGLVLQVVKAFKEFRFHKLGETFAALTVSDAMERVPSLSVPSTDIEPFIASLVMSKALNAALSHSGDYARPAMLRFLGAESKSPASRESHLESQLVEGSWSLAALIRYVEEGDHGLGMSKEYIESLQRNQKQNGGALKGNTSVGSFPGAFDIEEDIMGDLC